MRSTFILAAALELSICWASPLNHSNPPSKRAVPDSHVLHERHEPHWGKHWSKRARVPSKTVLSIRIGLKHSEDILQRGHQRLMDM